MDARSAGGQALRQAHAALLIARGLAPPTHPVLEVHALQEVLPVEEQHLIRRGHVPGPRRWGGGKGSACAHGSNH
jgi:hypothetical protein